MTLHLENGKDVVVTAPENSDVNRYVQKLTVNGVEHKVNYVNHADLLQGARMDYVMGANANENRGNTPDAAPYSFSKEYKAAAQKGSKKSRK